MKLSDIKIGEYYVVNDLDDAIVYQVEEIYGFNVRLSYDSGRFEAGAVDYCVLKKPTKKQLENK